MKKLGLIAATCILLGSPAIAATVRVSPMTRDFVRNVAVSDMFEIRSSTIAEDKLSGFDKGFADQMIADHTKTTDELTAQAKEDNIPIPDTMDGAHQRMLNKLRGLNGDAFKKQYFTDQVSAHKDAVALFERYGKRGDDAKLKDWATRTLPTLQHHLEMAQGFDRSALR